MSMRLRPVPGEWFVGALLIALIGASGALLASAQTHVTRQETVDAWEVTGHDLSAAPPCIVNGGLREIPDVLDTKQGFLVPIIRGEIRGAQVARIGDWIVCRNGRLEVLDLAVFNNLFQAIK